MGMDTPKGYRTTYSIPSQIYTHYRMHYLWECTSVQGKLSPKQLVNLIE